MTDIRKNDITYRCQCNLEDVLKDIAENTSNRPTILNLDVDYFFDFDKHVRDSYWTDDKIAQVAELLKNALDRGNVKVLTIAMSPECCKGESYCDGWKNSLDVTRIFSSILSDKAKNEFLDVLDKKTKNL